MLLRILGGSFVRQKRRKAVALAAVVLGTAAASALLDIALGVGDQLTRELRAFGANLVVVPAGTTRPVRLAGRDLSGLRPRTYLREGDVLRAKENFWMHNIVAVAPQLDVEARTAGGPLTVRGTWFGRDVPLGDATTFRAGIRDVYPFWEVQGDWPRDAPEAGTSPALAGASLARALDLVPGDTLTLTGAGGDVALVVTGILRTGGEEDRALVTRLDTAQRLAGLDDEIDRILVSALTTPEDRAAERLGLDPARLSPEEFEAWSCTPFVSSIAYQLELSIPGSEARPVRRVAEGEGRVLGRVSGLMALIAVMAAVAAALTVASSLTTGVLERREEIGLLKALGATSSRVIALFLAEAALLGLAGGLAGGAAGAWLARDISRAVFGAPVEISPLALPAAMLGAVLITLAGCSLPARRIASFRPFEVLHGL